VGHEDNRASVDPVLGRYRVDRALAALSLPLARALVSLVSETDLPIARLIPGSRAIVRTAVSSGPVDLDEMLRAVARAAVATLVELLFALGETQAAPTRTAGTLREFKAFARALK
jgi:hypothetical protein